MSSTYVTQQMWTMPHHKWFHVFKKKSGPFTHPIGCIGQLKMHWV